MTLHAAAVTAGFKRWCLVLLITQTPNNWLPRSVSFASSRVYYGWHEAGPV